MTPNFATTTALTAEQLRLQGISEAFLASYGSTTTPDSMDLEIAGIILQPVPRMGIRLEAFNQKLEAIQEYIGGHTGDLTGDPTLANLRADFEKMATAAQFLVFKGHDRDALRLPSLRPKPLTLYKVGLSGDTFTRTKVNGDAWSAIEAFREGKNNGEIANTGCDPKEFNLIGKHVALRTIYRVNVNNRDGAAGALFSLVLTEGKTPEQVEQELQELTAVE